MIQLIVVTLFLSLPITGHFFASDKVTNELNSVDGYYPVALSFSSKPAGTRWVFVMLPLKVAFPASLKITEFSNGEMEVSAKHPTNLAAFKKMPVNYFFALLFMCFIPYLYISAIYKIIRNKT